MGCSTPTEPKSKGGKDPAVCTDKKCPKATFIVYVGKDKESGEAISKVAVSISGPEMASKQTDDKGKAVFKDIKPGEYKVSATKNSYVPEPAEKTGINAPAGGTKEVKLALSLLEYHMHLDADRDGVVDDDHTGIDVWEWGKGKKGAIILCNNDGDGSPSKSDNEDSKINSGNDSDEVAPLEFRRSGPTPPVDWEGVLEVSSAHKDKIRIFDGQTAGAKEIIGPKKGNTYKFPDLNFTRKKLGMEAIEYAGTGFDGEIELTFTIKKKGSGTKVIEKGVVRVAPWIMPNHLDKAEKVYVVDFGANPTFRSTLATLVAGAGCVLQTHTLGDRWMQDCLEWGYACLPKKGVRSVMRAPRDRSLQSFPETLRKTDLGYHPQGVPEDSTFNSSGNLEVTPPVISKAGKKYPLGRIYYGAGRPGEEINTDLTNFLKKQIVQDPIEVNTNWLLVGHVDEIISTVPTSGGKGFKLLMASPKRAYELLNNNKAKHPTAKLLTGRIFPSVSSANQEMSIKEFLNLGLPNLNAKFTAAYLKNFNDDKQATLDTIRTQLEAELGLDASDIIDLPVLFGDISHSGLADAITAGVVNMLVINKHCIFPKPFGPMVGGKDLFEEDVRIQLKTLGLKPHPIDDWYEYHVDLGEVHCGTNTLRKPETAKWWDFKS